MVQNEHSVLTLDCAVNNDAPALTINGQGTAKCLAKLVLVDNFSTRVASFRCQALPAPQNERKRLGGEPVRAGDAGHPRVAGRRPAGRAVGAKSEARRAGCCPADLRLLRPALEAQGRHVRDLLPRPAHCECVGSRARRFSSSSLEVCTQVLERCLDAGQFTDNEYFANFVDSLGYHTVQFWKKAVPLLYESDMQYGTEYRDALLFRCSRPTHLARMTLHALASASLTLYDVNSGRSRLRELFAAVPGLRLSLMAKNAKRFEESFHVMMQRRAYSASMCSSTRSSSQRGDNDQESLSLLSDLADDVKELEVDGEVRFVCSCSSTPNPTHPTTTRAAGGRRRLRGGPHAARRRPQLPGHRHPGRHPRRAVARQRRAGGSSRLALAPIPASVLLLVGGRRCTRAARHRHPGPHHARRRAARNSGWGRAVQRPLPGTVARLGGRASPSSETNRPFLVPGARHQRLQRAARAAEAPPRQRALGAGPGQRRPRLLLRPGHGQGHRERVAGLLRARRALPLVARRPQLAAAAAHQLAGCVLVCI